MLDLVIKKMPENLHLKLKEQAHKNHHSMNKEVITIVEKSLNGEIDKFVMPEPLKGMFQLTEEYLKKAKDERQR